MLDRQIRYQYRTAELVAYVLGTLLSVLILLVWPALMLLAGVFSCSMFNVWTIIVVAVLLIATFFIGIVPLLAGIIQV